MGKDKIVCFAGHRYEWQNLGVERKLEQTIINLIEKGYLIFYVGDMGYFDKLSVRLLFKLKRFYPHIKIYKILVYYHQDNVKWWLPSFYDGSILPDIEHCHPKAKIIKRNEWVVDNSDVVVCHIYDTLNSGAYRTVKYAQKKNKKIIQI